MKLRAKWSEIPLAVRGHLMEGLKDRSITADDLSKLQFWFELGPDVPEGDWYKNFWDIPIGWPRAVGVDVPFRRSDPLGN